MILTLAADSGVILKKFASYPDKLAPEVAFSPLMI